MGNIKVFNIKDCEAFNTIEGVIRPLAIVEDTALYHFEIPPDLEVPLHFHNFHSVIFTLEGEVRLLTKEGEIKLEGGDVVVVPSSLEVGLRGGDKVTKMLVVTTPSTFKSIEEVKERFKQFAKK